MNQYFSRSFVNDNKYSISSYIAHKSIYDNQFGNTMLMYPSRQMQHSRTNFAFHPNFVDECMKIEKVYFVKMKNIENVENIGIQFKSAIEPIILYNVNSALREIDSRKSIEYKNFIETSMKEDFKID